MSGTNEKRIVNEATGGEKGRKDQRFDLIPWGALAKVAEHYGKGAEKYDDHNWRRGYAWSLSTGAMSRHLAAFMEGEDMDEETGTPHMAAVAFHALTLLTFADEHPELDDRYKQPEPEPVEIVTPGIKFEVVNATSERLKNIQDALPQTFRIEVQVPGDMLGWTRSGTYPEVYTAGEVSLHIGDLENRFPSLKFRSVPDMSGHNMGRYIIQYRDPSTNDWVPSTVRPDRYTVVEADEHLAKLRFVYRGVPEFRKRRVA